MSEPTARAAPARGGDRDQPRARREVEHAASARQLGMIEDVARQRLPAGPGKGPVGRRQAGAVEEFLGGVPERRHLARQMEAQLGDERR